jgi:deoxyadenosine/deoxycytidine kinase
MKPKVINIHGPIAVGKTSLATNLRQFLKSGIGFDEPQINNPVLDLFYKDQKKYAFVSQLSFFNDLTTINIHINDLKERKVAPYIINDSSQLGNLVFTQLLVEEGKLSGKEYDLLIDIAKLSSNLYQDEDTYSIVILKPENEIIEQLKKRGRDMELSYDDLDYFTRLAKRYNELFQSAAEKVGGVKNIITINASGLNEKETMQATLDAMNIEKKVNRIILNNSNEM